MNKLDELKQQWTADENYQPEIQQRIWDRAAQSYGAHPIPTFEDNYFLQYMEQTIPLTQNLTTLDIGCGSGVYSMALAPRVGQAVGVDISPKMIEYANARSKELELDNAKFHCVDWSVADIDKLGFRGAFDVVFAHMTPAIADFNTFDKMNACSRNLCLMEKPTRRKNMVQDAVFHLIGLDRSEEQYHGGVLQAFSYLWYKGYCPKFYYHDVVWNDEKTVDDMVAWCADRAKLHKELTAAEEETIRAYVAQQAVDGLVHEITTTTKVTMIWSVQ